MAIIVTRAPQRETANGGELDGNKGIKITDGAYVKNVLLTLLSDPRSGKKAYMDEKEGAN